MICWYLAIPHLGQDIILDINGIISIFLEPEQLLSSAEVPIVSRYVPKKNSHDIILLDYHRNLISIQRRKHRDLSFQENQK